MLPPPFVMRLRNKDLASSVASTATRGTFFDCLAEVAVERGYLYTCEVEADAREIDSKTFCSFLRFGHQPFSIAIE